MHTMRAYTDEVDAKSIFCESPWNPISNIFLSELWQQLWRKKSTFTFFQYHFSWLVNAMVSLNSPWTEFLRASRQNRASRETSLFFAILVWKFSMFLLQPKTCRWHFWQSLLKKSAAKTQKESVTLNSGPTRVVLTITFQSSSAQFVEIDFCSNIFSLPLEFLRTIPNGYRIMQESLRSEFDKKNFVEYFHVFRDSKKIDWLRFQ